MCVCLELIIIILFMLTCCYRLFVEKFCLYYVFIFLFYQFLIIVVHMFNKWYIQRKEESLSVKTLHIAKSTIEFFVVRVLVHT